MVALKIGVKKTFGNRCITIKTKKGMKKNLFMVAAVALMALVSCNKEEINNNVVEQPQEPSYYVEFVASIAEDADTKAFDAATPKTYWVEGEAISINGKKFEVKEVLENGNAIFENKEELGEGFGAPYNAVYPYSAGTSFDAVTVPSEQTAIAGNIAPEALVAVAQSENNTLKFKHLVTLVKFQVSTEGINELEFSSASALAGTIKVKADEGTDPTYSVTTEAKTVKVKSNGASFETNATYYVSVLPTLGAEGTKQTFEVKSEGVVVKSGNVTFKRNKVMNAKSIEVKYTYLKPSLVWNLSSPRYAAYFFEGEDANTWVDMNDADGDGVYRAVVPEGYTNLIYCRMNPSNKTNSWDARWNQSADLNVPSTSSNAYIIGVMQWDKGSGKWDTLANAKSYRENAVYLKPNSNWKQDNAWFAVYLCNGSKEATWRKMTSVNGTFYGVELPSDFNATNYKNIIFVRMDPKKSALDWGSKWNQSGDLASTKMTNSPYNRCCAINNGQWDCGANVTWTTTLK